VFVGVETGDLAAVLAVILWFTLGWQAGVLELLAELAIGLMLYGGGGGKRIRQTARRFAGAGLRIWAPAPS
jgi:hypothetical protein